MTKLLQNRPKSNAQKSSNRSVFSPFTHISAILSAPKTSGKKRAKKARVDISDDGKNATSLNRKRFIFGTVSITEEIKKADANESISSKNEKTQKSTENAVNIIKKLFFSAKKAPFKTKKGDNIKKTPTHFFDIIPLKAIKIRLTDYFLSFFNILKRADTIGQKRKKAD